MDGADGELDAVDAVLEVVDGILAPVDRTLEPVDRPLEAVDRLLDAVDRPLDAVDGPLEQKYYNVEPTDSLMDTLQVITKLTHTSIDRVFSSFGLADMHLDAGMGHLPEVDTRLDVACVGAATFLSPTAFDAREMMIVRLRKTVGDRNVAAPMHAPLTRIFLSARAIEQRLEVALAPRQ